MRVAVTGAGGRLGRALVAALEEAPFTGPLGPLAWSRPAYDIDDPAAAARCVRETAPEVVVHTAAWTDVDACAREPERAMRRNAMAVAELADACVVAGAGGRSLRPLQVIVKRAAGSGTRIYGARLDRDYVQRRQCN